MEKVLHQLLVLGEVLCSSDDLDGVIHLAELDDIQIAVLSDIGVDHGIRESNSGRRIAHDIPAEAFAHTVLLQSVFEHHLSASEYRARGRHKTE